MKTTPEHFELFKSYMEKWLDKLGIKDLEKYYTHSAGNGNEGAVIVDPDNKMLMIQFSKKLTRLDNDYIERIALHESLEVLFDELELLAGKRYNVQESDIRKSIHGIIRTLENILIVGK